MDGTAKTPGLYQPEMEVFGPQIATKRLFTLPGIYLRFQICQMQVCYGSGGPALPRGQDCYARFSMNMTI